MRKGPQTNTLLITYFIHHLRVLLGSLGRLTRQPLSTLMTMAVIAIALTLPAGLYLALNNISGLSAGWDSSTKISLFLHTEADEKQAQTLLGRLQLHNEIEHVSLISKDQGLEQFKQLSGFGDALEFLESNPLPIVLVIQPIIDPNRPDRIDQLLHELESEKLVELAQLDMQWVKRLYALLEIANRVIWAIGSLLGLAVLLIVGNTIRLDIQNRRAEIEVSKLIGASNAFIRRPFLYTGFWYGLSGGLLAWLLTTLSLYMLAAPVEKLALLYHSDFQLSGLDSGDTVNLIMISCGLGLLGSWLAVGRHLDEIEPS
ncbi:MAG: permease-like cell division protein FtsX [Gammaproteobacteria bacterium]|nr:permease-like cell division protein FtsX [Gammaproteobacteria bacterium]